MSQRLYEREQFEVEGVPAEPQEDSIYVLDGRGQMIRVEVDDDATDD